MNKNFSQKLIGISVIILLIIIGVCIYFANTSNINTITVYKDTVEEKIIKSGIVTSEFTGVKATQTGEALFSLKEGRMVKPYTKIATVYSGEMDDESRNVLKALNDKIVFSEALESSKKYIIGDLGSVNRDINQVFDKIISETNENNYDNVYEHKSKIISYNEKVMELKGVKVEKKASEDINEQIKAAEAKFNQEKKVYTSPVNGMFSAKVSNFDELINPEIALKLTPKEYDKIDSTEYEVYSGVAEGRNLFKIINNYEWYLVGKFSKEEVDLINKSIKNVNSLKVRIINNSDNAVECSVSYISDIVKNEAVVVLKSTKHIDGIWTSGKVDFELITSTKTGIKIPQSAVIEKGGKKGVYVIKDSVYKFVEIDILLKDKNYFIVRDNATDEKSERENVILYDFVVINPKNVVEGSIAS